MQLQRVIWHFRESDESRESEGESANFGEQDNSLGRVTRVKNIGAR